MARQASLQIARLYAGAGFAVAIDDIIYPTEAQALFVDRLPGYTVHKVLLQPGVEIALARNASRTNKQFDTSALAEPIRKIHQALAEQKFAEMGWTVVNNSAWSVEETVDAILERVQ